MKSLEVSSTRSISNALAVLIMAILVVVSVIAGFNLRGLNNSGQPQLPPPSVTTVTVTDTSEIAQLQAQVNSLNDQIQSQNSIINIQQTQVLESQQPINWATLSSVYSTYNLQNAGYIAVTVQTSTDTNTQVQVTWTSNSVSYSNTIKVGTSGTAYFPILPSSNVQVTFSDQLGASGSATISITYYY